MADDTTTSGGTAAAGGTQNTSGGTQAAAANSGGTVTSGGSATSGGTPAAPASSGGTATQPAATVPGDSASPNSSAADGVTSGNSNMTGCKVDSNNNLIVEEGTSFSYTLNITVDASTKVTGYLPEGINLDLTTGQLTGTPKQSGATTLVVQTLSQPSQAPVTIPVIIEPALTVGFLNLGNTESLEAVFPCLRGPGDSPAVAVTGSGGNGSTTYKLQNAPGNVTIDANGQLGGQLPTDEGTYTFTVQISDGIVTKSVPVSFTVSKTIPLVYNTPETDAQWWANAAVVWQNDLYGWIEQNHDLPYTGNEVQWNTVANRILAICLRFAHNPTVNGVDLVKTILETYNEMVIQENECEAMYHVYSGADMVLMLTGYGMLGGSRDDLTNPGHVAVRRMMRTQPPITLLNNWTMFARIIDLHAGTNTDLKA